MAEATATRRAPARYLGIAAALRAAIAGGQPRLGECLPPEHDLRIRFGVSRGTVRQALALLRDEGLIAPQPGLGTVVVASHPPESFQQVARSVEELLQYPGETWRDLRHVRPCRVGELPSEAAELGDGAVQLVAMRRLRQGGLAISWLVAHLRADLAPLASRPNPDGLPLVRQIEAETGLVAAQAEVRITSEAVPADIARAMDAPPGAPALMIQRRYRDHAGRLYLVTRSLHPDGRFALTFDFNRQPAERPSGAPDAL